MTVSEKNNTTNCWWFRNPANHLKCIKPCKQLDFNYLSLNWLYSRISEPLTLLWNPRQVPCGAFRSSTWETFEPPLMEVVDEKTAPWLGQMFSALVFGKILLLWVHFVGVQWPFFSESVPPQWPKNSGFKKMMPKMTTENGQPMLLLLHQCGYL